MSDLFAGISAVVALLAFFRPEISKLIRGLVNKVDLYPTGRLEVGFSSFGPTIGLAGSLRAVPNSQFVQRMLVQVVRARDRATYTFEWAVFRPLSVGPTDLKDMQLATGFVIGAGEARPINVQFHDQNTRTRIDGPLSELRGHWLSFLKQQPVPMGEIPPVDLPKLYNAFGESPAKPVVSEIYQDIARSFYWEPGDYELTLNVLTANPYKEFERTMGFVLSDEDSRQLRLNLIGTMLNACGVPTAHFNFANVEILL